MAGDGVPTPKGTTTMSPMIIIALVTALLELANKLYAEYQATKHAGDPNDADWAALEVRRKAALADLLGIAPLS